MSGPPERRPSCVDPRERVDPVNSPSIYGAGPRPSVRPFAFVSRPCFASFSPYVQSPPSILTNMAFRQSRTWSEAVATICRENETPADLYPLRHAFRLLKLRSQFDAAVSMGPRPSRAYGLLCATLPRPSQQILAEDVRDEAQSAFLPWRVNPALFRRIACRAPGILANRPAEVGAMARRLVSAAVSGCRPSRKTATHAANKPEAIKARGAGARASWAGGIPC